MKLLLGLCLVIYIAGVCCEDISNIVGRERELNQYITDCAAESKVDMKTLADVDKNKVIPNTPEMQCYLACMMKKEGMMNADGTLSKRFLEEAETQACKNLGGKDTCEVAYKAIECFTKAHPNGGLLNKRR